MTFQICRNLLAFLKVTTIMECHSRFCEHNMYTRTLKETIYKASNAFPVVMITGPRQVGKTTLFADCKDEERGYVSLDDLEARALAQHDPGLFIQTYPAPIIIDEIQYAPNLFSYIKQAVDKQKKNGLYWLTGSQKFHLMKGVYESLAGRVALVNLLGLSQSELKGHANQHPFLPTKEWIEQQQQAHTATAANTPEVFQRIFKGSFPRLYQEAETPRDLFYQSYIATYIQRDVKDILAITDETAFLRYIQAVAARTGTLLNYADIARDVGIDQKTAKAWLSVLESAGLVYLLKPYYNNVNKRLVKAPKIYFLDTGLCTYLTKWPTPETLQAGAMSGALFETYVVIQILTSYWHNGLEAPCYYYRDKEKREIDLLLEQGNTIYPVEIKKTATPSKSASKHFSALEGLKINIGYGTVICCTEKASPLSDTVTALPVDYL